MSSASSVLRCLLLLGVTSFILVACATSGTDSGADPACGASPCSSADGGKKSDAGKKDAKATGDDDDDDDDDDTDSGGGDDDDTDAGGGNWVDMTGNTSACHEKDGVPCGWAATNNGSGSTCACRHGAWAEGWSCEPPNAPVTAGASCPGVIGTDAGSGTDSSTVTDSSTHTDSSVGGWVDMSTNASACDNKPNVPCGWNPTPTNTGYTCLCRHGAWADGWTCEIANAPVSPGPSCP